jgi:AcrR family transcriptional regulator
MTSMKKSSSRSNANRSSSSNTTTATHTATPTAGNEAPITRERVLEAAEDTLRRFGPSKTTVVDVARALGVSHGSVYRHFPSKNSLRDAVAERWLARVTEPLNDVVTERGTAVRRLSRWFELLMTLKRRRALEDPQMFATYVQLVESSREVVAAHVDALVRQLTAIIIDGVANGELMTDNADETARALFDATIRFHHPMHAAEWADEQQMRASLERVFNLALRGLSTP